MFKKVRISVRTASHGALAKLPALDRRGTMLAGFGIGRGSAMLRRHKVLSVLLLLAGGVTCALAAPPAQPAKNEFRARLIGAVVVPSMGDGDGNGLVTIRIDQAKSQLCYTLTVAGLEDVTAAAIHKAFVGYAGPSVLALTPPTTGSSQGCVPITSDFMAEMLAAPYDFYVSVDTESYPGGALRGQLRR